MKELVQDGKVNLVNDIYPYMPNRDFYLSEKKMEAFVDQMEKERFANQGRTSNANGFLASYD